MLLHRAPRLATLLAVVTLWFGHGLQAQSSALALAGGTVIVRAGDSPIPAGNVVVRGGRVVCAGVAHRCPIPAGVQVVDARGRWVIPGLFDAHVHLTEERGPFGPLFLSFGITSVRDMGGYADTLRAMRAAVTSGAALGPRLFYAGHPLDGVPPRWAGGAYPDVPLAIRTAEEARQAVRRQRAAGADFVKLYSGLSPALLAAAADEAHQLGIRSTADLFPWQFPPDSALAAGIDGLEHQIPPLGPAAWARDSAGMEALVRRTVTAGVALTSTMVIYERWTPVLPSEEATYQALPPALRVRSAEMVTGLFGREQAYACRTVRAFAAAGGQVLAGTDAYFTNVYPGDLHRELELLVSCGLTPAQALAAATRGPAEWLRLPGLGTLVPGAPADLLVLRADPLADIRNTRAIEYVVADGRLHEPAALVRAAQ